MFVSAEMLASVTQARNNMRRFVDEVIHEKPAVLVQRGRSESFWAVAASQFMQLLSAYRFTMEYEVRDDGRYYGSIKQIPDIIGSELRRYLRKKYGWQLLRSGTHHDMYIKVLPNETSSNVVCPTEPGRLPRMFGNESFHISCRSPWKNLTGTSN